MWRQPALGYPSSEARQFSARDAQAQPHAWTQTSQLNLEFHAHVTAPPRRLHGSHLADRPVSEMSFGEARRVLIARTLVHDPLALLFDEPCNSPDLSAQQSLRQTMRTLANSGIGIILVTHELADIVPEIQRVVLMKDGQIAADGPKEDILCVEHLAWKYPAATAITTCGSSLCSQ
jgi:ABC-type multidrug transport system ATPase subunit